MPKRQFKEIYFKLMFFY